MDYTKNTKRLRTYNLREDVIIYVDDHLFDRVKHCKWYYKDGKVLNGHGIQIEQFLGIPDWCKRNPKYPIFDYRVVVYSS